MLDYARSIGWQVREGALAVPSALPAPQAAPPTIGQGPPEFVFFGRLEQRQGLKLFLEAARSLPREVTLAFVGKETRVGSALARELIASSLGDRPFTIHSQLDPPAALEFLSSGNRVAVMPSLVDNYPLAVLKCAAGGIPFLASNVGGIPEIVSQPELQSALLFQPTPRALAHKLQEYASLEPSQRQQLARRMQALCEPSRNHAEVCRFYANLLPKSHAHVEPAAAAPPARQPLVSIVVPYYNLGAYLPQTLASLAAQDYGRTEVIVVNDGSTDPHALEVWEQVQILFPQFHFVTQDNQGLGAARNAGLALAAGEYFLPVDADNVARPEMVSCFVQAHQRRPELAAATCFLLAFRQTADIAAGRFQYAYRPSGGPFVAAALRNIYGDANAMFRTAALREAGGFETEKETTCEDWEVFVKLVRQGRLIDVVPEYLFYYRHRPQSLLRTTDPFLNRRRVLRQFFPAEALPLAERIALWTVLASFDHQQNRLHKQLAALPPRPAPPPQRRSAVSRALRGVKNMIRQSTLYGTISSTLQPWKGRAA
jgi:GT2 family glycosyltransferase